MKKNRKATAIAVVPCLNEERTVAEVINSLKKNARHAGISLKVIAVDDASEDLTKKALKGRADIIIALAKRVPLAEVVRQGLKRALEEKPDMIIHIDADGQYDPSDLKKIILPIIGGDADFVIGTRQVSSLSHMPMIKKLGNHFFTMIVNTLGGVKVSDAQSGFRAISWEIAEKIVLKAKYTYTQEQLILAKRAGARIMQVPISFKRRRHGRSRLIISSFNYGINALKDILAAVYKN